MAVLYVPVPPRSGRQSWKLIYNRFFPIFKMPLNKCGQMQEKLEEQGCETRSQAVCLVFDVYFNGFSRICSESTPNVDDTLQHLLEFINKV